jgi:hypothetical protein
LRRFLTEFFKLTPPFHKIAVDEIPVGEIEGERSKDLVKQQYRERFSYTLWRLSS